eukprot:10754413-Ditylum_brightwellii.AAC.1
MECHHHLTLLQALTKMNYYRETIGMKQKDNRCVHIVMHDMSNLCLSQSENAALNRALLYGLYYGGCCRKGGILLNYVGGRVRLSSTQDLLVTVTT